MRFASVIYGSYVPEGDVDVCDLCIFTGCDLYDKVDILHVCTWVGTS